MRELLSLIKIDLNTTFGLSAMKYKYFKQKKELWQPIILIVALLSLLPAYGLFIAFLQGLYMGFKMINQEGLLLLMGFMASQIVIFLFGIMFVISKFYFSSDLETLIPLPIKPRNIINSKFISMIITEYLTVLPIVLPFIIVFGLNIRGGIMYWIASILIIAFLPIIPLGLASIIVIFFMRVTNIKGRRDLLRVIGFVLILAIVLGIQIGVQSLTSNISPGEEQEFINSLVQERNSLLQTAGRAFPPSRWAAVALSGLGSIEGTISFGLFMGASILAFYIVSILGEKLFIGGLIGGQEITAKRKRVSNTELEKLSKPKHPIVAVLLRELRILVRTPVFMMNSIGAVIMIPIFIVVPAVISGEMTETISQLNIREYFPIFIFVVMALIGFIGSSNGVASTTFSREGKQFWISRALPGRVEDQVLGKILSALAVQCLGIVTLIISLSFIITVDFLISSSIVILGLLVSIPLILIGMIIDIHRPLLDWDNPQKAMKQNLNVMFSILGGVLYIGISALLIFLMYAFNTPIYLVFTVIIAINIGVSVGLYILLRKSVVNRYVSIE